MNNYKINIIHENKENINEIFIKVLKKNLCEYLDYTNDTNLLSDIDGDNNDK